MVCGVGCRFDQVRYRLLDAYLHTAPEQDRYPDIKQAEAFLHMPKVRGRGKPRRCWFHELVEAGELDAAGYGAVLSATARRRTGDRDWALRTLERAWKHGSRNAELADNYASMLITDRRVRTRTNLKLALDVLDEALAAQHGRRGRIYGDLAARRERVQKLLNAPVQTKPKRTVNKRPPRSSRMLLD